MVVDESARGQGTGEAMMQEAIRLAREAGAKTVDLTSRPAREAAGRLYERLGFTIRETRLYRLPAAGLNPPGGPAGPGRSGGQFGDGRQQPVDVGPVVVVHQPGPDGAAGVPAGPARPASSQA